VAGNHKAKTADLNAAATKATRAAKVDCTEETTRYIYTVQGGNHMDSPIQSRPYLSRRDILKSSALAIAPLAIARANYAAARQQPMTANGGTDPYPIPWLDKFGSHNQAAGPNNEPGHIYHFKGRVVRCNNFTGVGTDNQGNRIAFGAPSTDYGWMQGEYWAARAEQQGTFVHI